MSDSRPIPSAPKQFQNLSPKNSGPNSEKQSKPIEGGADESKSSPPVDTTPKAEVVKDASPREETKAQNTPVVPVASRKYRVRPGDSLAEIAQNFGVPGGWQQLYSANRNVVGKNPHLLPTGTVLVLP